MKRSLSITVAGLVLYCFASNPAWGHTHRLYAASLGGPNWEGFPVYLQPDLVTSNPSEKLEIVRAPIYIHSTSSGGQEPLVVYNPPVLITTLPWWPAFYAKHTDAYPWDKDVESAAQHDPAPDVEWHTCPRDPAGLTLNAGDYMLHDDGTLSVSIPKAGGIGSKTFLRIASCTLGNCQQHENPTPTLEYIVVGWNHPGTIQNHQGMPHDAYPGDIVVSNELVWASEPYPGDYLWCRLPMLTVHWTSTDIAKSSIRVVDASDLAHFLNCYGDPDCCYPTPCPLRWGFSSDVWNDDGTMRFGQEARSYHLNVSNALGTPSAIVLNDEDLSYLTNDLGKTCGGSGGGGGGGQELESVSVGDEAAAILTWFGLAPTGDTIVLPSGETILRYTVVDWNKARVAAENPFGYLGSNAGKLLTTPAKKVPWGLVKSLYR